MSDFESSLLARQVWAEWNALPEDEPSPVKRIAWNQQIPAYRVAEIVYPPETFGSWNEDQEPELVDGLEETMELAEDAIAEVERLRERLVGLEDAALGYIRADYLKTHAWTKTILCSALDHPDKYPEGEKPAFSEGGCPCGKRRTSA